MVISVHKHTALFEYISEKILEDVFSTFEPSESLENVCKLAMHTALSPLLRQKFQLQYYGNEQLIRTKIDKILNASDFKAKLIIHCIGEIINEDKFIQEKVVTEINNILQNEQSSQDENIRNLYLIYCATKIDDLPIALHEAMFDYVTKEDQYNAFLSDARSYINEHFGLDIIGYRLLCYKDKPLKKWVYYLSALAVKDTQGLEFFEHQFAQDIKNECNDEQLAFLQKVFTYFQNKHKILNQYGA